MPPRKSISIPRAVGPDSNLDILVRAFERDNRNEEEEECETMLPDEAPSSPHRSKRPRVDPNSFLITYDGVQNVSDHEESARAEKARGRKRRSKAVTSSASKGADDHNDGLKEKPAEEKARQSTRQRSSSRARKAPTQFQPEMATVPVAKLLKKVENKAKQPKPPAPSPKRKATIQSTETDTEHSSFKDHIIGDFLVARKEDQEHLAPLNVLAGEQFYFCKDPNEANEHIRFLVCIHCGRPRRLKDEKDLSQNYHQVRKHILTCKQVSQELKKAIDQPLEGKTLWGFLDERWDTDFCVLQEGFEPPPKPKATRTQISKPKPKKSAKGKAKKGANKGRSKEGSDEDRWDFIQNGKVAIAKMYRVMKESTKDEITQAFQIAPFREYRVQKIVRIVDKHIDEGYAEDLVTEVMESERGTKSLYSFADDVNNFRITGNEKLLESFLKTKDRGPKIMAEVDPSSHEYVEETGFLYHDPKTTQDCERLNLNEEPIDELSPIPQSSFDPMRIVPDGTKIKWTFDQGKRVLLADFRGVPSNENISDVDLRLFAQFMERDDITLISEGLFNNDKLDAELWDLQAMKGMTGNRIHHKLKRFTPSESNPALFDEIDMLEGPLDIFFDYIQKHLLGEQGSTSLRNIEKMDETNDEIIDVDTAKDVVYAIDIDLPRLLPKNHLDFQRNFRMKQIMPGGEWCMMSHLPASARPFMGPNMYITPGGSYTHLHQDGNGTVDSGHCVLSGYNEVVMLRRLTERHKENACKMLPNRGVYDALYTFPHEGGPKPDWPSKETIAAWEKMGYAPSVFILKPGQHVHINKGRLHCFRKVTRAPLPEPDCHHNLRKELLDTIENIPLCISVAWDWQYLGVSPEGINREVASSLECQNLIDTQQSRRCLAIPRACILQMGKSLFFKKDFLAKRTEPVLTSIGSRRTCVWNENAILRGINPSLQYVLQENIEYLRKYNATEKRGKKMITKAERNDTEQKLLDAAVDPDGNDYFCKLCNRELENVYLHCDGCENLLQKDFNICTSCFENGNCQSDHDMIGRGFKEDYLRKTTTNHIILFPDEPCGCGAMAQPCFLCRDCTGCGCTCHSDYTVRRRFYDLDHLEKLQQLSIEFDSDEANKILHGNLTKPRLVISRDRANVGMHEKQCLLADRDNNKREAKKHEIRKAEEEANRRSQIEAAIKERISSTTSTPENEVPEQQVVSQAANQLHDENLERPHGMVEAESQSEGPSATTHPTSMPSDRVSSESEDSREGVGGASSSSDVEGEMPKAASFVVGDDDDDESPRGAFTRKPVSFPDC